jgi:hypothetical protein
MMSDNNKVYELNWCGSSKRFFRIVVENCLYIGESLKTYLKKVYDDEEYDEVDCESVVGKVYWIQRCRMLMWVLDKYNPQYGTEYGSYENNVVIANYDMLKSLGIVNGEQDFECWFYINTQEDLDNPQDELKEISKRTMINYCINEMYESDKDNMVIKLLLIDDVEEEEELEVEFYDYEFE